MTPGGESGQVPMRFEAMRCDTLGSQRPAVKREDCLFEILGRPSFSGDIKKEQRSEKRAGAD